MPYCIDWEPGGATVTFSEVATFKDVFESEGAIQSSPDFDALRFVISVFKGTSGLVMTEPESDLIFAMRIGASRTNPRIKYAYVSNDVNVREMVESAADRSNDFLKAEIFQDSSSALTWAKS